MSMRVLLALGLLAGGDASAPTTCGGLKAVYKTNGCCGHPTKAVTVAPACPYNFTKPLCSMANVQAPRDLSSAATGLKVPKAATLTLAQTSMLPLANVHYHLGAEHKSDSYNVDTDSKAWDAKHANANSGHRRLSGSDPRPGWMCAENTLSADEKTAYTFQHCKGAVTVGKSYEVHYVHSSAGFDSNHLTDPNHDLMDDGLGGAANGRNELNPMVTVQAQIFQIVNAANSPVDNNILHGWTHKVNGVAKTKVHTESVMYTGSTTGTSHDNTVCSPYTITWQVDKKCTKISAASWDNFCKQMKDLYKMEADLYPHSSRILLDPKWVVPNSYVKPLA